MALLAAVVVDHFHIIGVTVDEAKDDTQLAGHRNGGEASPVSGEAVDSIAAPAEVLGGRRGLDEGQDATDLVGVLGGQPPAVPASEAPGGATAIGANDQDPMLANMASVPKMATTPLLGGTGSGTTPVARRASQPQDIARKVERPPSSTKPAH